MVSCLAYASFVMLLLGAQPVVVPGTHHQLPHRSAAGEVSDAELVAYAQRPFEKAEMMQRTIVLGSHRGTKLIAEFPCSDLCPQNTARIIRYELKAGEVCATLYRVQEEVFVPEGVGLAKRLLCVPAILAPKRHGKVK